MFDYVVVIYGEREGDGGTDHLLMGKDGSSSVSNPKTPRVRRPQVLNPLILIFHMENLHINDIIPFSF